MSRSFALSRSGLGGVLILVCHYSGLSGGGSRIILKMDALGLRRCETPPRYLNEVRFTPWLSLWRSSGEILNNGCKSLRSDLHRAGERMINFHNGQQPGKD